MPLPRATFPRSARVRARSEFTGSSMAARRVAHPAARACIGCAMRSAARLGLAVSRKVDPHAVGRNRIKRMLRDEFRHLRATLPPRRLRDRGPPGRRRRRRAAAARGLLRRCCSAAARCRRPATPGTMPPAGVDDRASCTPTSRLRRCAVDAACPLASLLEPRPFPMNQTRTLLIVAWLARRGLVVDGLGQGTGATPLVAAHSVRGGHARGDAVDPGSVPAVPDASLPAAPAPAVASATPSRPPRRCVTVTTDVLRVTLDGGAIHSADILRVPDDDASRAARRCACSPTIRRISSRRRAAGSAATGAAPSHEARLRPGGTDSAHSHWLRARNIAAGAVRLARPGWRHHPPHLHVHRAATTSIGVRDEVVNQSATPWQGFVYRQLVRVPPQVTSGMTHPESYSFHGAAWFSDKDKLEKRKFAKFGEDPRAGQAGQRRLDRACCSTTSSPRGSRARTDHSHLLDGGAAARPGADPRSRAGRDRRARRDARRTQARLWVGPKLVKQIEAQHVPGLERAVDFSSFTPDGGARRLAVLGAVSTCTDCSATGAGRSSAWWC